MRKQPRLSASTMRPIYEKYLRSGQTIKAFCSAEQLNHHTFNYWRLKFIREKQTPQASFSLVSNGFQSNVSIVIRVGEQIEGELPSNYPVSSLTQLLSQLSC